MTAHPQPPLPPPESQLIAARRAAAGQSMRSCAKQAGLSPERWRQVETGVARVARGTDVPVTDVPPATIARMALVVRATPAELTSCGRPDAAADLEILLAAQVLAAPSDHQMLRDLSERLARLEEQFGRQPPTAETPKRVSNGDESNGRTSRAV